MALPKSVRKVIVLAADGTATVRFRRKRKRKAAERVASVVESVGRNVARVARKAR